MKRFEKIALSIGGPVAGPIATFYVWSANYAAASFFLLKSSTMWKSFTGGDTFMPVKQAWVYFGNPNVSRLVTTASLATLAEAAIIAGGIFLLITQPWRVRPPADGSRFATREDLEKAGLLDGIPGKSILLGTFGKGRQSVDVRYSGDSHFFLNGPTRSGKGRSFVMPNLLEYQGSVFVLDVKLENYFNTGAARRAMGQKCYVFAPGSTRSHRWNPLDFVRAWPERSTDLLNLAASLIPINDREEPHWKMTARGLLAAVLGYVLESATMEGRRNLRSALRLFSTGRNFSDVLDDIIDNEPKLNDFILAGFRQHLARDWEQRPSFESHIITALGPFNNLLMAEACAASDFDIRDLRRKPFSLFIAAPVSDFGTAEPIIRLLIQQIHDLMLRNLPGEDEPHKILMMLDEFYQFERLPEIVKRAPLVAGYGLTIVLVAQNIAQLDERYGQKTRDALIGNMDLRLCIAVGDDTTAKIVSDNLGRKYVEREGWSKKTSLLFQKQASSGRFELIPLMDPGTVQRLGDNETILQIRGSYGAILNKLNFYTDTQFLARRREVESLQRELTIPEVQIAPEWPLFTTKPPEQSPPAPAATTAQPDAASILNHDLKVMEAARAVFMETGPFLHFYRLAIMDAEDRATADLLFRLRTAPETIAPLRGSARRRDRQGQKERQSALSAIWRLREVIANARWLEVASRMNARPAGVELYFYPAITPAPSVVPSPHTVPADQGEDQDEDNRLEAIHGTLKETVDKIVGLAHEVTPEAEKAADSALQTALTRLRNAADEAMAEPDEINQIQELSERAAIASADKGYRTGRNPETI